MTTSTSTSRNSNKTNKTRKAAAIGLGILGIAGLSLASAAQLNLGTASLGAGTTVIASCQADAPVGVSFDTSFTPGPDAGYKASSLTLTDIAGACNGLDYKVTLTDEAGSVLGSEATGTISGSSLTLPLSDISAEEVANVAVVINS